MNSRGFSDDDVKNQMKSRGFSDEDVKNHVNSRGFSDEDVKNHVNSQGFSDEDVKNHVNSLGFSDEDVKNISKVVSDEDVKKYDFICLPATMATPSFSKRPSSFACSPALLKHLRGKRPSLRAMNSALRSAQMSKLSP